MVLFRALLAATALATLAAPASAQFDPAFNHLKCYRIKGKAITKTLVLENQFGREKVVKLTPYLLCTPTKKTCCANPATVAGCTPVPCPPDPTPNQPDAVDHYKCYKIAARYCAPVAGAPPCTSLAAMPPTLVTLVDQFVTEQTRVGRPQILCAPVLKRVDSPTTTSTTTTSTTTTTTTPCRDQSQPGTPPMCGGACPTGSGLACVFIPGVGCTCELPCELLTSGACSMQFCPKAGQQCLSTPTNPCGCCYPPGAGPCTSAADCCSGVCTASGVCQ